MENAELYSQPEGGYPKINLGDVPLPSFTREQKLQIKQYADHVVQVLDEIEVGGKAVFRVHTGIGETKILLMC
jgi:hypothetical protein